MRNSTKLDKAPKRPRGRPRAYEPEAVLRQALELFWKTGYAGTSLDDIAAATGVNRPSLKAGFGDKHAIYLQALADYWERKYATMREALEGDEPLEQALMRVYEAALSIYFSGGGRARGCFVVGTAVTEALADAEISSSINEGFGRLDGYFEARLRKAHDGGELDRSADPVALALLASATMHSIAIRARAGASRDDLRQLALKAVGVICGRAGA
jgi:TetR/AcrR family transcriptional regulator, copper-responsive repressor